MDLNKEMFRRILLLVTLSAIIVWAVFHPFAVWSVVQGALTILTPFILGLCIAFAINLLLRPIESRWDYLVSRRRRSGWTAKLKRPVCIVLSGIVITGVIFVLLFIVLPEIVSTIGTIIDLLPGFLAQMESWWSKLSKALSDHGIVLPQFQLDGNQVSAFVRDFLMKRGLSVFGTTVDITTSIIAWGVNFIIALVFSLYVLAQKERLGGQMRRFMVAFLPEKTTEKMLEVASLTNRTFAKFVTGQLADALIVGILCFIGMLILSIPYAATVSVLVGATSIIPVFGALIGTGVGALLIVMAQPIKALWFVLFIIVLQQFESNVIYPRIVGQSVGLPAIWVLAAITIGGSLFGLLGMLVSVPVGSVLYTLVKQTVNTRLERRRNAR